MNHFLRIYVPLTVIVVMSWTCFLIDYRSVPARTSMNAALVLTVITFITSIQQTLPRTSAIRLLDIHMMVCFFYVFAGLVEYSFALSMEIRLRIQERKTLDEEIKVWLRAETAQCDEKELQIWAKLRNMYLIPIFCPTMQDFLRAVMW